MAHQYIYTMKGLRMVYPPGREVLKGIWLSFLPGAKIGVLGGNGAGKSTLLRIMAGVEQGYQGEAQAAKGIAVGYLPQEPELDPEKTVLGNIEEGVAETRALLRRFDELNLKMGESLEPDAPLLCSQSRWRISKRRVQVAFRDGMDSSRDVVGIDVPESLSACEVPPKGGVQCQSLRPLPSICPRTCSRSRSPIDPGMCESAIACLGIV